MLDVQNNLPVVKKHGEYHLLVQQHKAATKHVGSDVMLWPFIITHGGTCVILDRRTRTVRARVCCVRVCDISSRRRDKRVAGPAGRRYECDELGGGAGDGVTTDSLTEKTAEGEQG